MTAREKSGWVGSRTKSGGSEGDGKSSGMIGMTSMGRVGSAKGFRPRKAGR